MEVNTKSMSDTISFDMFVDQPFETTVSKSVCFEGVGLHSGRFVRMRISPAPANHGIKFRRVDVEGQLQTVVAHANYAKQSRLCTRIVNCEGVGLDTIEHFMASFAGIGLDNAVIEINAAEAPILDGSSQPIIEALNNAGLKILPVRRKYLTVLKAVEVGLDCGAWARIEPSNHLQIDVEIQFNDPAIGNQSFSYHHRNGSFAADLAYARTFCQLCDVELMQNAGLAMGGSLNNAIVVDNGRVLNKEGLRIDTEFARHKALDCLGDLSLLGMPIKAHLTAYRPGHALSTQLVQTLLADTNAFAVIGAGAEHSRSDSFAMPELAVAAIA